MQKPPKTLADYVVVAISPMLIMALVGSLAFFLIQVFYRGAAVHAIRWLMFWFVIAIVLVSRVGIEVGKSHARFYGVALALATWFYLAYSQPLPFVGALLLAIAWWCAHRLTTDCTLVDEDEDASGESLLRGLWRTLEESVLTPEPPKHSRSPLELLAIANLANHPRRAPPKRPGRTVIYFSLAALPLFGIGQLFLPADDPHARRMGFAYLACYLGAALSLLMTTSFLGMRRYLRKRFVEMPAPVAFAWIRFGAILAVVVLLLAVLLPRPGAQKTWKDLTYRISHKQHEASDYALPFNPPGEGEGTPATQPVENNQPGVPSRRSIGGGGTQTTRSQYTPPNSRGDQAGPPGQGGQAGDQGQAAPDSPPGNRGQTGAFGETPPAENRQAGPSTDTGDRGEGGDTGAGREPTGRIGGNTAKGSHVRAPDLPAKDLPRIEMKDQKPSAPQPRQVIRRETPPPENTSRAPKPPSQVLHQLLRVLLILIIVGALIWLLIRYRRAVAEGWRAFVAAVRAFLAAIRDFFRRLFSLRRRRNTAAAAEVPAPEPALEPFATYQNPFVSGNDRAWPPEKLLFYTYAAVRAWAKEQGIEAEPQQTPREFCNRLIERFPDFGPELERFSYFYGHAAFANRLPEDFDTEPVRRLWQYLGDSVAAMAT